MRILYFVLIFSVFSFSVLAFEFKYISNLSTAEKQTMNDIKDILSKMLPPSFLENLHPTFNFRVDSITNHLLIPENPCDKNQNGFTYGEYSQIKRTIRLNRPVLNELVNGESKARPLKCQHKDSYRQALAVLIHELAHDYYLNQNNIDETKLKKIFNYKQGFLGNYSKNKFPFRSPDFYETSDLKEAFAVNFEYFILDSEFSCRRPLIYKFYKELFNYQPFSGLVNCYNHFPVLTLLNFSPSILQLDLGRVYRIDYVDAVPGLEEESAYGHSMLRIVICAPAHINPILNVLVPATEYGKKCEEDTDFHLFASFRANQYDQALDKFKAVFGGYKTLLFMFDYPSIVEQYTNTEFRDLIFYPLKLQESEKNDLMLKILEMNWSYQGEYKYLSNNCATETLDLVQSVLNNRVLDNESTIRPMKIVPILKKAKLIDHLEKDKFTAPSRINYFYEVLKKSYFGQTDFSEKSAYLFMTQSKQEIRKKIFDEKMLELDPKILGHDEIYSLKLKKIRLAYFQQAEHYILKYRLLVFSKMISDYISSLDINNSIENKSLKNDGHNVFDLLLNSDSNYGIPIKSELNDLNKIINLKKNDDNKYKELINEKFSSNLRELLTMESFYQQIGLESLKTRKEYRSQILNYIKEVINNLKCSSIGYQLLLDTINGNQNSMIEFRTKLDLNIFNHQEVSDKTLTSMISQALN